MLPLAETPKILDTFVSPFTAIGNKYGDIYENMLERAMASNLNKNEVPHYYEKYMKPVMNARKPRL